MPNTLRRWIFEKYLPRNLDVRNEKTRRNYGFAVDSFTRFLGRPAELADLNDETFAEFLNYLHTTCRLAETTVNGYAGKLKAFWDWAARKKVVEAFPTVGRLPVPERLPVAWRSDELAKIFNGCRSMPGTIGDVPAWRWWFTLNAWLWCSSERIGATFAMRIEHLRLNDSMVVLPAGIRKGRRKSAVYRLWPDLVEMLRAMTPPSTKPREFVFEWDQYFDRGTFYNRYAALLRRAGLPDDRYRKPHAMRVSHASWLQVMGGDPTRALGHDDPATTRKSYIDPTLGSESGSPLFHPWDLRSG